MLHLIVMGADLFSMHELPERGLVSIGRDDHGDVHIDDANASHHHARLHVGPTLELEDLGSASGTRLRGARLAAGERTPVLPGEAIPIGWTTLMIEHRRPAMRRRRLPAPADLSGRPDDELGPAPASADGSETQLEMRRLRLLAERAAAANINVLILGETGVGKEVMAETIHRLSPRAAQPFVRLNCAALSPLAARERAVRARARRVHRRARGQAGPARDRGGRHGAARRDRRAVARACRPSCCA